MTLRTDRPSDAWKGRKKDKKIERQTSQERGRKTSKESKKTDRPDCV